MQRAGFWLGVGLFAAFLVLPPPDGLSVAGWRTAAVTALMATWWFTEAVPVTLTGSLPFLVLPLLGVAKPDAVAGQYMSPVLFLVLGGAVIGLAFEKWDLHRRMALGVISRAGADPSRLLFAIMAVTAFISMWVNNSATTVMMIPIATATLVAVAPSIEMVVAIFGILKADGAYLPLDYASWSIARPLRTRWTEIRDSRRVTV